MRSIKGTSNTLSVVMNAVFGTLERDCPKVWKANPAKNKDPVITPRNIVVLFLHHFLRKEKSKQKSFLRNFVSPLQAKK